MLIIGDVHGKFDNYLELTKLAESSIQIGDMGFNYSPLAELSLNHRFIKGNHDNYEISDPHDLGDFGIHEGIFYIRGAASIDRMRRIEGKDWFADEQLSYARLQEVINLFESTKPKIVISHDCPQSMASLLCGIQDTTLTRLALQTCFGLHQPELWIFGHHHRHVEDTFWGTKFVCLGELETFST